MSRKARTPGVGMPAALWLDQFGSIVWEAFGGPPYHVGSSLMSKKWRDVDVRLILSDGEWRRLGFGRPGDRNGKLRAFEMAFSELGRRMTGLPIDFQIQQQTDANNLFDPKKGHLRSALGCIPLRYK